LAELRTDLDAFTETESNALMACGYQMAAKTFQKEIAKQITELAEEPIQTAWPFAPMLHAQRDHVDCTSYGRSS
jgi:hypothetical protein